LDYITGVLTQVHASASRPLERAGDLLHVLVYVADTTWNTQTPQPAPEIDPAKQMRLLNALSSCILGQNGSSILDTTTSTFCNDFAVLLRLLQFQLGFTSTWNTEIKELVNKIAISLFSFAMASQLLYNTTFY
jgi:hypothetical protein